MRTARVMILVLCAVLLLSSSAISAPLPDIRKFTQSNSATTTGKSLYDEGRYDQALEALTKAIEARPENARANYLLALTYEKLDQKDNAIGLLKDYLAATGNAPDAVMPMDKQYIDKCKELLKKLTQ